MPPTATPAFTLKRDGNRTVIEGLEKEFWGGTSQRQNSTLAALSLALRGHGEAVSYEELMGLSGAAFRIQVHRDGLCPSSPHANCGFSCTDAAMDALGRPLVRYKTDAKDPEQIAKARDVIKRNLDRGRPVLNESEECALIAGYQDGPKELLVRSYSAKKEGYDEWTGWPWNIAVIGAKSNKPPARKDNLVASLKRAVELWNVRRVQGYFCGASAYDRWITSLAEDTMPPADKKDERFGKALGNAFVYECLLDARRAAARYLNGIADEFAPEAQPHLRRAAELYGQLERKLAAQMALAPHPWRIKKPEDWTPEMRKQETALLAEVRELDGQAIAEIAAALSAAGVALPRSTTTPSEGKVVILDRAVDKYRQLSMFRNMNQTHTELLAYLAIAQGADVKDVDYALVVAASGYGTCFGYHPKKCQVTYTPPESPDDTWKLLGQVTGFGFEWLPKQKSPDEAWSVLTASLDKGFALQGNFMDDFVFAGYQDSADPALCRVYHLGGWERDGWWTWEQFGKWVKDFGKFGRHTQMVPRLALKDLATLLLPRVALYATQDKRATLPWLKGSQWGLAGMEAYAADLEDLTKPANFFSMDWWGCHAVNRQYTGRPCFAAFLRRVAPEFPQPAADHLLAAAGEYEACYAAWRKFESALGATEDENAPAIEVRWAAETTRKAGAAAVREAIAHEKAALEEVGRAERK